MCGSGMRAAMFAHDMLVAGSHEVLVAGGMESMTNAPYLLPKARGGYRIGHDRIFDHMMLDGLEDAYEARSLHGHLRRRLRRQIRLHPRRTGRVCYRQRAARPGGHGQRCLCHRNHTGHGQRSRLATR
jgi:acetyl-CoA acetyltransferase